MLRNSDDPLASSAAPAASPLTQPVAMILDHPHHHSISTNYALSSYTIQNSGTSFLAIKSKFDRSRPVSSLRMSAGRIFRPPSRSHLHARKTSPWLSRESITNLEYTDTAKQSEFSNREYPIPSLQHADSIRGSATLSLGARRPPKRKLSIPHHVDFGDMLVGAAIRFDIDRSDHTCKSYVAEIPPYLIRFTKSHIMKHNSGNTSNITILEVSDTDCRPIEAIKRPRYASDSVISPAKEGSKHDHGFEETDHVPFPPHFPPTPSHSRCSSPQSFSQLREPTPPLSPPLSSGALWQAPLRGLIAAKGIRTSANSEHENITGIDFVKERRANACASCHTSLLKNKHTGKHLPALWPTGSELCKKCTSRYALHREHCPKCLYVPSALELRQNATTCSACYAGEWVYIPRD